MEQTTYTDIISKPIYQILTHITHTSRMELALPLAIKELVSLKLKETSGQIELFEHQYGTDFDVFKKAWNEGRIPNRHSYEVERDYREWEAAVTDCEQLRRMQETLL